jgi:hypothetical protein
MTAPAAGIGERAKGGATMEIYTKAAKKLFDLARQKAGPLPPSTAKGDMEAHFDRVIAYIERVGRLHRLSAIGLARHFSSLKAQEAREKSARLAAESDAQDQLIEEVELMVRALGIEGDDYNQMVIADIFKRYLAQHPEEKGRLTAMGGEIAMFASVADE